MTPQKYNQINELIADYSTIAAQLETAEASIKLAQLDAATELLPTHAELSIKLTGIETKLRALADEHYPELFPEENKKRSHDTPFGTLKYHKSSSLEFKDAEKVLLKIKIACDRERDRSRQAGETPRFTHDLLIRTHEEPNLLVLESFDDATLSLFGIAREHKDTFKVQPFAMKSDKPSKKKEAA